MYVRPIVEEDGSVLCFCRVGMRPVLYHDFETDRWWLFWRCGHNSGHVTHAIPVPYRDVTTSAPCG